MSSCPVDPMLVDEVAYRTWRKWKPWAERDDIKQELWCWALGKPGLDELEPRAVGNSMRDVAERFCRREKAQRSGYRAADEAFYTLPVLRELIPIATSADGVVTRKGVNDSNVKASRSGAAGPTMEFETMIMDVKAAMATIPVRERILLIDIYATGKTYAQVGAETELTEDQVNTAVSGAIRRLQRALGGRKPAMK